MTPFNPDTKTYLQYIARLEAKIERLRADYEAMKKLAMSYDEKDDVRLDAYRLEVIEECAKVAAQYDNYTVEGSTSIAGAVIAAAIRALATDPPVAMPRGPAGDRGQVGWMGGENEC